MARKISISFKETKKDIELYNFINSLDDKSADLKSALRNYYKNQLNNSEIKKDEIVEEKEESVNVLDF